MTNTQKIIDLLQENPGLDDDEISPVGGNQPQGSGLTRYAAVLKMRALSYAKSVQVEKL